MGESAFALRCHGLTRRFDGVPVVDGFSLAVARGEVLALLGPSGCGKTTVLRLIAGFESLDAGEIAIAGRVVARRLPGQPVIETPPEQRRVGMVFQDYALFPHMSVGDNVGFGLAGRRDRSTVEAALAGVGLAGCADRDPASLSGGQQQRVALARALAPRPDLLLLDEPFSNLDVGLRASVREDVADIIRGAGATAVLVTHDQEEALSLADRVALMLEGRIAQVGTPADLYERPASAAVAAFVGEAAFLPAEATGSVAACCLGSVPLHTARAGPVTLVVRPEAVGLTPETAASAAGVVLRRRYLGHAQLVTVRLDAGPEVHARTPAAPDFPVGARVGLRVTSALHALPNGA